jgi:hypothetical protein
MGRVPSPFAAGDEIGPLVVIDHKAPHVGRRYWFDS